MLGNRTKLNPKQVNPQQGNSSISTKGWNRLGHELLGLWQQTHGAPDGAVSVMAVQGGLMVFMENAFSQAELALARQSTDNLLPQYIDGLTCQMMPTLTARVEQVVGQQIRATNITSNIEQNWMMVLVRFDEPTVSEGYRGTGPVKWD